MEVCPEGGHRLGIKVDGRLAIETRAKHPEGKAATAAEKVDKSRTSAHLLICRVIVICGYQLELIVPEIYVNLGCKV